LGANSLLSCLTGGAITGPAVCQYADGLEAHPDGSDPEFASQVRMRVGQYERLKAMDGPENPFKLWAEMGQLMTENMTVVRYNDRLRATEEKLVEMQARYERIGISDVSGWTNQVLPFTRQLQNMLTLARVMTRGALLRDESRGAHYKPDFPDRDDVRFLKTTVAEHTSDGPKIRYEEVDISQVRPRPRKYTTDAPASKTPVQIAGAGKVPVGVNGATNDHANGYAANGRADGLSRGIPAQIPGEEVAGGGNGADDPLATTPAGGHPRDGGGGTEQSQSAPNMADIEPGKGGAN